MALPLGAQAQGACQGSLSTSSPSAPALAKYTPAAERSGVVFHGWLDAMRTPPSAHLVIENTNPYPVAVRFEAELRGGSGPVATGSRCVWIRTREFALDVPGLTVFEYPGTTLSQVRIGAAEIAPLERPPAVTVVDPPRAPAPRAPPPRPIPRPRADTPRAEPAAPEREAVRESVRVMAPPAPVQPRSVPAVRAIPPPPPKARRAPPPAACAASRTLRVAAGVILVPAGVVLGIAVAASLTLLAGIVPLGALRKRAVEQNVTPPPGANPEAPG